ncbi:hypothetical protein Pmani_018652 [Petrolisthes manimaculis]|uniref:Uncharacterized protein n=1 Tax=Petrolisthes manimaculis TaxID=1843537 RepID=A0AAE1U4P4_9EUCA|nr:hypothetical protein Pmani_018652 [Petrolisthes manimaculis]
MASEPREPPAHHTSNTNWGKEESTLRRRLPWHLPKRPNDIYLDANSNYKAEQERGVHALSEVGVVVIHGIGTSIPQAIVSALSIQTAINTPTTLHTNTSTIFISDDPRSYRGREQDSQMKGCPVVHIKISLQKPIQKESN